MQRVAIARTLASDPSLILLDEPFSNLDKQLGVQLRNELKSIFKSRGFASILVTHDQQEAFAYADTVAVMKNGIILQTGSPEELYLNPGSYEVAEFLGNCQFLEGEAKGKFVSTAIGDLSLSKEMQGTVSVLLRPENIIAELDENGDFEVSSMTFLGSSREFELTNGKVQLKVISPVHVNYSVLSKVKLSVNSAVVAFIK